MFFVAVIPKLYFQHRITFKHPIVVAVIPNRFSSRILFFLGFIPKLYFHVCFPFRTEPIKKTKRRSRSNTKAVLLSNPSFRFNNSVPMLRYIYVYMFMYVYISISIYLCVCICMYLYIYIYICICMLFCFYTCISSGYIGSGLCVYPLSEFFCASWQQRSIATVASESVAPRFGMGPTASSFAAMRMSTCIVAATSSGTPRGLCMRRTFTGLTRRVRAFAQPYTAKTP